MSTSRSPSPRKTSLDAEPLLPTYEQFQSTSAESPDSPPETTATPDEIRDFLTRLLISKRGLTSDHARRISSKWTIGNGKELRSYPPSMYLDIFGREDGWVVYKEAKLCIAHEEKQKGKATETPFWLHCIFMFICLAALGGVGYGFIWGMQQVNQLAIWSCFLVFWPVFFLNIGCLASFGNSSDPEKEIEKELQACVKTCGTHDS